MNVAMERAHAASNWQDYETQDDIFHRTIAEASDNLLLLSLFDQLNVVRRAVAWGNVRAPVGQAGGRPFELSRARGDRRRHREARSRSRLRGHAQPSALGLARLFGEV